MGRGKGTVRLHQHILLDSVFLPSKNIFQNLKGTNLNPVEVSFSINDFLCA